MENAVCINCGQSSVESLVAQLRQAQEERDRAYGWTEATNQRYLRVLEDARRFKAERDAAIGRVEAAEGVAHDLRLLAAEAIGALRAGRDLITNEMMGLNQNLAGWCEGVDCFDAEGSLTRSAEALGRQAR